MLADPVGYWQRLRNGGDIRWSDEHRGWLVLGHAAVVEAFRDGVRLSADRTGALARAADERPGTFGKTVELLSGWMIFRDPPAHTRLRDPVRVEFTPRRLADLEKRIVGLADDLLDPVLADGRFEMRAAVAGPLPAHVIAELLGVPAGERERFAGWSDDLGRIVFSIQPRDVDPGPVAAATDQFVDFFTELIEHYRRHPADNLITALVEGSGDLSEIELIGACTLLLFAGHETTTNLLTTAVGHLAAHPDDQDRLRAATALDATAVDEFVRTQGPAATMVRKVGSPHERGGRSLESGQTVYLSIASANFDPGAFDDPATFDMARDPNPHLGFGWGLHHCLGAALARLETRIVLRRLLERTTSIDPDGEPAPLRGDVMGRARIAAPVLVQ